MELTSACIHLQMHTNSWTTQIFLGTCTNLYKSVQIFFTKFLSSPKNGEAHQKMVRTHQKMVSSTDLFTVKPSQNGNFPRKFCVSCVCTPKILSENFRKIFKSETKNFFEKKKFSEKQLFWSTCTNLYKSVQICTNLYKSVQICTNLNNFCYQIFELTKKW